MVYLSLYVALPAVLFLLLLFQCAIYPYFISPLRTLSGPFNPNLFAGSTADIIQKDPGIPYLRWSKSFGSVFRVVGPVGIERVVFMRPEALHRILVTGAADYPRVSGHEYN